MKYSTRYIMDFTTNTILKLLSEEELYRYYFNSKYELKRAYSSPFRRDERPSFSLFYSPSTVCKIRWRDFATGESGGIFDFIMKKYLCNLYESLVIIDNDFNLGLRNKTGGVFERPTITNLHSIISSSDMVLEYKKNTRIDVRIRAWNFKEDKDYWFNRYSITCDILNKFNVYPLTNVWLNGKMCLTATKSKPIYGYYFGDNRWKIYNPLATSYRWLSNVDSTLIQGFNQLPDKGEYLVITKSLKDVLVLHKLGISAIAPQSETVLIKPDVINSLRSRFNKIILNFDYDLAGVISTKRYVKEYNLPYLFFTRKYGTKDISDYCAKHGLDKTIELINNVKKNIE